MGPVMRLIAFLFFAAFAFAGVMRYSNAAAPDPAAASAPRISLNWGLVAIASTTVQTR